MSEKYAHVSRVISSISKKEWVARVGGKSRACMTEREAAIEVDKMLIALGKKPVNILKPQPSSPTKPSDN